MSELIITVIVPVYNTDKYLEKCLESIINQSYRNLEIILVNDGSTDSSLQICQRYAKQDIRVKVINKSSGGVVSARKAGVKYATGDFIGWVDADDWIDLDYIEMLVKAQVESGADMVVAGHYHEIGKTSKKIFSNFPLGLYLREQLLHKLLYTGNFFEFGVQPHLVTKLTSTRILKKTQEQVDERIHAGDDAAVVYPSILEADKIYITNICGYHYVQHQGSITKTTKADELERFNLLFEHFSEVFTRKNVMHILYPQLESYRRYFLLTRNIEVLDITEDIREERKILLPYGGLVRGSKVIIYGAGVLGQKIYQYISRDNFVSIVLWVDQSFVDYEAKGMSVCSPEEMILLENNAYDYVLIANTVQKTAKAIEQYLIDKLGISKDKIRWLSSDFLNNTAEILDTVEKDLEKYDNIILLNVKGEMYAKGVKAFLKSDAVKNSSKKILFYTIHHMEDMRGKVVYRVITEQEMGRLQEIYHMYEFSNRIQLFVDESNCGSLWNYLKTGILTEEQIYEALLH